jgi:ceramide glucosyltransferase
VKRLALIALVGTLGALSAFAALHSMRSTLRYWQQARQVSRLGNDAFGAYAPEATLIVPCCGDEEDLEANLEALVSQEYPQLRVRFVVEGAEDAALPAIARVRGRHPGRSEVIVAGPADGQGQKVHNLLVALEAGPVTDVLAFADSDGRPDGGWLRRLVAGLARPDVGVASSYRFYRPVPASVATLLRSAWNLSVLSFLGDHERNFAWGGAMALRSDVFERARVREAWRGALSDDYALTHAVRRIGLRVLFVPGCLVGSEGAIGLRAFLGWSARQIAITRVYWPALFRLAAVANLPSAAFLVLAPIVGGALPLALLGFVLALGATSGGLRARALATLVPRWREDVDRFLWAFALMAPLSSLVTAWGILRALASRRIEWRGKVYEMRGPDDTVILEAGRPL